MEERKIKTERCKNYSQEERNLLAELAEDYPIVNARRNDEKTISAKKEAWQEIHTRFHSALIDTDESRTIESLKKQLDNMKTQAKRFHQEILSGKREPFSNGGNLIGIVSGGANSRNGGGSPTSSGGERSNGTNNNSAAIRGEWIERIIAQNEQTWAMDESRQADAAAAAANQSVDHTSPMDTTTINVNPDSIVVDESSMSISGASGQLTQHSNHHTIAQHHHFTATNVSNALHTNNNENTPNHLRSLANHHHHINHSSGRLSLASPGDVQTPAQQRQPRRQRTSILGKRPRSARARAMAAAAVAAASSSQAPPGAGVGVGVGIGPGQTAFHHLHNSPCDCSNQRWKVEEEFLRKKYNLKLELLQLKVDLLRKLVNNNNENGQNVSI